jgi:hypothetical protein
MKALASSPANTAVAAAYWHVVGMEGGGVLSSVHSTDESHPNLPRTHKL